ALRRVRREASSSVRANGDNGSGERNLPALRRSPPAAPQANASTRHAGERITNAQAPCRVRGAQRPVPVRSTDRSVGQRPPPQPRIPAWLPARLPPRLRARVSPGLPPRLRPRLLARPGLGPPGLLLVRLELGSAVRLGLVQRPGLVQRLLRLGRRSPPRAGPQRPAFGALRRRTAYRADVPSAEDRSS